MTAMTNGFGADIDESRLRLHRDGKVKHSAAGERRGLGASGEWASVQLTA